MGSEDAASASTSSAIARASSHIKRRSVGRLSIFARNRPLPDSGGDPGPVGLVFDEERSSRILAASTSIYNCSSRSNSFRSSPRSGGDEERLSAPMQHVSVEVDNAEKDFRSFASQGTSISLKATKPLQSSHNGIPGLPPTEQRCASEKPILPAFSSEDAQLPNNLLGYVTHTGSTFHSDAASPGSYKPPDTTPSPSNYPPEALPVVGPTSQAPFSQYGEACLSPSISIKNLSYSRSSPDMPRNSDITLSIAPSPPMPSSAFQPHSLSSPSSLTNRTLPQTGPHRRTGSSSSGLLNKTSESSFFTSMSRRRSSTDLARDLSGTARATDMPTSKGEQLRQARWKALSLKTRRRSSPDDIDPIHGWHGQISIARAKQISLAIAAACLGPFFQLVFPDHARTRRRVASKTPVPETPGTIQSKHLYRRWHNRAFRLLLGAYILYSLYLFTCHLLSLPIVLSTSNSGTKPVRHRQLSQVHARRHTLEYTAWQQARFRILDAYRIAADALATTAGPSGKQMSHAAASDFAGDPDSASGPKDLVILDPLPEVQRRWGESTAVRHPAGNPLASFSTDYRFSKLFSKLDASSQEQIEPFLFQATSPGQAGDVTACLYFNDAWISELPAFMERWRGPASLVYELAENKSSPERLALITQLQDLRNRSFLIRQHVDIHVVYNPPQSDLQARRLRERFILRPVASNFQLNLARFFAKTGMIWLVGDARVLPAPDLRQRLNELEEVRTYTVDFADAIVVPMFGATRRMANDLTALPLLAGIRESIGLEARKDGVRKEDFYRLSEAYVLAHHESIPLRESDWPANKTDLVGLVAEHSPPSMSPKYLGRTELPIFTLFDRRWEAGESPTNFTRWKEARYTPMEERQTFSTAKMNIQSDSGFYQVTDDDHHYAPSLIIGRERQPWCTEKFEYKRAACIYQMYLHGTKKWVLPDSWAFTLEQTHKTAQKEPRNNAEKLKNTIESRLYKKFSSEACMHYGRAFLLHNMWESERAQQLRKSCAKVLNSYGIGLSEEEEAAAARSEQQLKTKKQKKKKKV